MTPLRVLLFAEYWLASCSRRRRSESGSGGSSSSSRKGKDTGEVFLDLHLQQVERTNTKDAPNTSNTSVANPWSPIPIPIPIPIAPIAPIPPIEVLGGRCHCLKVLPGQLNMFSKLHGGALAVAGRCPN
jgi:hypothetical protein